MKRAALGFIRFIDKAIGFLLLIAFIVVLATVLFFMTENNTLVREADSNQYRAYKPTSNDALSLDELKIINPDVIGWITLDDTPVDYPVVQGTNNSKYVNTSVFGEFALSGALFLDYRNSPRYTDTLSIIYGHNMAGSVMFGDFYLYEEDDYYEAHRTGSLYFDGAYHTLRVVACFAADGYDLDVYHVGLTDGERADWLEMIRKKAFHCSDDIADDKPLLMLSTCAAGNTNGRTVLLCEIGVVMEVTVADVPGRKVMQPTFSPQSEETDYHFEIWIPALIGLTGLTVGYFVWTYQRKERVRHGRK